jgi:hypothetical protein
MTSSGMSAFIALFLPTPYLVVDVPTSKSHNST